jgi:Tol biopolymer transport system component
MIGRAAAIGLALLLVAPGAVAAAPEAPAASGPATNPPGAPLPAPPGTTSLVSFRFGGSPAAGPAGGGPSAQVSISADGRFVAFTSNAPDLVSGDTNGALDVFVLDRATGKMTRLGLPGGVPVPPGGSAQQPSISADGRVVAYTYQPPTGFTSVALGSVVLAWDRKTGIVEVVSKNTAGNNAQGSRQPSVSADGRFVAFVSDNGSVAGRDGNEKPDVFRYDRTAKQTVLISARSDGISTPSGTSNDPSISADGNLVAFVSDAGSTILLDEIGSGTQVYVRDVAAGVTTRVSDPPGAGSGEQADGPSSAPAISADGRYVAFESSATNLVPGDTNGAADVFRRDRTTGTTTLVSVTSAGMPAKGSSGQAAISADGRVVAFASTASDLVALGGGIVPAAQFVLITEVYARDVDAGQTVLVSATPTGDKGGGGSQAPAVSSDGRFVAFASTAAGLVPGDRNGLSDAFLRDMPPVPQLAPPVLDLGARAVGVTSLPAAAILSNKGWSPLAVTGASITGAMAADFQVVADSCSGVVLHRAEACTVSVTFTPSAPGERTATLEVADAFTGSPRTARLRGQASLSKIKLDPPIGPPGTVTIATGSGFPPNTAVRLQWSIGITPHLPPVVTDAGGNFRVQVLVFHNDRTGTRELLADAVDGSTFPETAVPMFVSQAPTVPPSFVILRLLDLPLVMVMRG